MVTIKMENRVRLYIFSFCCLNFLVFSLRGSEIYLSCVSCFYFCKITVFITGNAPLILKILNNKTDIYFFLILEILFFSWVLLSEVNSGTTIFCERNQREHVFWLLQNLGCIGSGLIDKQRHVLECLHVYWDNPWFNFELRLILTYFKYILYKYTKHTQPPGYSLSMNRTISDTFIYNFIAEFFELHLSPQICFIDLFLSLSCQSWMVIIILFQITSME